MKIKDSFILRNVADVWVVAALGEAAVDFSGMLKLNETGALLWKTLENGAETEDLVDALCAEYVVDREQARADVEEFLNVLRGAGCI